MIYQQYQKLKEYARARQGDLFLAGLIVLVSVGSFGLGRLSVIWPEKQPLTIMQNDKLQMPKTTFASPIGSADNLALGKYVASKNGLSYHFPWCSGAKRIKEENKVWFQTKEEAEAGGYKPAANCDGL